MYKLRAVFLKFRLGFLLSVLIMSGFASAQTQKVIGALSQSGASEGDSVTLAVSYQVTDDDLTTGLGLRVHFDSSKLSAGDVTGLLSTGLAGAAQFQDDSSDFDNDSSTDKFLFTSWFDFGGSWPNGTTLPAALYSLPFTAQSGFTATTINFSRSSNAFGYAFRAESVGIGNNADTDDDDDGDGVADTADAFPLDSTETVDTDLDGIGNNADTDDDNDGVEDSSDSFPLDPAETVDTDLDGIGNNADSDDDNDGVLDINDAFPLDRAEALDTDFDGVGNNADTDDDGDGVPDAWGISSIRPNIVGEKAGDKFAYSLSFSDDGKVIAIGAIENDARGQQSGEVEVYQFLNNVWEQMGEDISEGGYGDRFGQKTSISGDGRVLAVGSNWNNSVYTFFWDGENWVSRGALSDFDNVGDLTLSNNGDTLIIGDAKTTLQQIGSVHIYSWNKSSAEWVSTDLLQGVNGGDYFGFAVALSKNGETLVIGAMAYDAGKTFVYKKRNNTWSKLSNFIEGDSSIGPPYTAYSGASVDVSENGNRVIVGAYHDVAKVYEVNGTSLQQMASIPSSLIGRVVNISNDGDIVSVTDDTKTEMYRFQNGNWVLIGNQVEGSFQATSIAGNGSVFAISDMYFSPTPSSTNVGRAKIFDINVEDVFPLDAAETIDTDSDGVGNNADTDDDGDGVLDTNDAYPLISLNGLTDTDFDGLPNECDSDCVYTGMTADADDDGDGVADSSDAFPLDLNETTDTDSDGLGNNADTDDDGDGVLDTNDAYPLISLNGLTDIDFDGLPNECDSDCLDTGMTADADDDGDGVNDTVDAFPLDSSEQIDTDGDGIGDNSDLYPDFADHTLDSDSDGMPDAWEARYGLDPNDPSDAFSDQDNDGVSAYDEFIAGTIPAGSLDLDGNGQYDALTDGLLLLRGMFGLSEGALISGAVASDAAYASSSEIVSRIDMLGDLVDIDGNGRVDALTDGLIILRYLFGLRGGVLINGVIASDATITSADGVGAKMESLMPAL